MNAAYTATSQAEAATIYCSTRDLADGLRSGLIGSLQKYGYNEKNRSTIVKASKAACTLLIYQHSVSTPWNHLVFVPTDGRQHLFYCPEITESELGQITYYGLEILVKKFGVQNFQGQTCEEVIAEIEEIKISTTEESFSLSRRQEAAAELVKTQDERKEAFAAAQVTINEHGGPWGGTGDHMPGVGTFGSFMDPGSPQ
ncbi:hypothetical protein LTR22_019076 [Elasticomyces elasticus]|nr:hypothetical protein LTR22_019076 [Elasticomyces elasticus]KAK4933093.1 hypothetical protein LTR49_000577 [Elasticomyces elasticus]